MDPYLFQRLLIGAFVSSRIRSLGGPCNADYIARQWLPIISIVDAESALKPRLVALEILIRLMVKPRKRVEISFLPWVTMAWHLH